MKLSKEWSKNNENNYKWLFNFMNANFKDINEFTFIDDNKRQLMGIIEKHDKWSDGSKEALFFTVGKYLKLFGNEKYGKMYSDKGYEYLVRNRDLEHENKQDDKEIENYRQRDFFINILEKTDTNDIQTQVGHFKYLLLSLLVYQPPLRTSFYISSKFMRKKNDNNKTDNYVWITKRGSVKVVFIVNEDKVKNTKKYNSNMYLSYIDVENAGLSKLINASFEKYPREFLFELNGKPITQATLLSWLRDITGVPKINIDMMRSSYINYFYSTSRNMKEKEVLSRQMRHSVITAQSNYLKVGLTNPENKEDVVSNLQIENNNLQRELKECKEETPVCADDATYRKKRRDVLYLLNKKGVVSKEKTLKKYNIKFSDDLKEWV